MNRNRQPGFREKMGYGEMRDMILRYLPDFCWQSVDEVITMLEQIDENISVISVQVTLSHMGKTGVIERRRHPLLRYNSWQLKKVAS